MKGKCSYLNFYLTLILGVWLSGWVLAQGMVLIEEPAGVGRIQEPLSVGITFPKGTLQSGDPVRLLDENNLPVDAQFMNMGFWPDGSVRWRKADFQVSLPAGAQRRIAVEAGTGHPVTSGLTVADNAGLITVNTGPLRFTVSKNAFSLIEEAWLDRNRDGIFSADERVIRPGGAAMVQQGGTVYSSASGAPVSVAVEENGPMKVVIRISGFHHNGN
ncbi:MAG: hypothetical protein KDI06_09125, partial [Calditrichaeota bacterium]|nr:hypothetical protein [Calditrichota bacterium]